MPTLREGPLQTQELQHSQQTTLQAVAPETGFYRTAASTWRGVDGECDIQYEMTWHVE